MIGVDKAYYRQAIATVHDKKSSNLDCAVLSVQTRLMEDDNRFLLCLLALSAAAFMYNHRKWQKHSASSTEAIVDLGLSRFAPDLWKLSSMLQA